MSKRVLVSVLLILGCVPVVYAQYANSFNIPPATQTTATISLTGTVNASPASTGGYNFTVTGSGTISGLGNAMLSASGNVSDVTSLSATSPIAGSFSLDYGGGNTLNGTFSIPVGILLPQIGGSTSAVGTMTINSGSGKYTGATGSFSVTGSGTATGVVSSTISAQGNGSITLPATSTGTMAHFASGGGWTTTVTLVNTGTTTANTQMNFYDESGNAVSLPVVFPQSASSASSLLSTVSRTLAAGAELVVQSGGQANLSVGSIQLVADGTVTGFVFFRSNPNGQEGTVPLETRNPSAFVISFDNTNFLVTGVALSNVSSQPASVKVIIRDDTGATLGSDMITLSGRGHTSFVLTDRYGLTAKTRGTLEFQTPSNGQISAIGLRFSPSGALTNIPAIAK